MSDISFMDRLVAEKYDLYVFISVAKQCVDLRNNPALRPIPQFPEFQFNQKQQP